MNLQIKEAKIVKRGKRLLALSRRTRRQRRVNTFTAEQKRVVQRRLKQSNLLKA